MLLRKILGMFVSAFCYVFEPKTRNKPVVGAKSGPTHESTRSRSMRRSSMQRLLCRAVGQRDWSDRSPG